MFICICRVEVWCVTEYHKLKWWASHSYSLDFFGVILSAHGLDFDFLGCCSSVRINGSSTMAHSSALRIKLWPPKILKSLILFLANFRILFCVVPSDFLFQQIPLDISYVSLDYEYRCWSNPSDIHAIMHDDLMYLGSNYFGNQEEFRGFSHSSCS